MIYVVVYCWVVSFALLWWLIESYYVRRMHETDAAAATMEWECEEQIQMWECAFDETVARLNEQHSEQLAALYTQHSAAMAHIYKSHAEDTEMLTLERDTFAGYADLFASDDHDWHIGGRESVHGHDAVIRYECSICRAVVHAAMGVL